jgi:cytochrome c-type biogenesis protein CcmH
MKSLNSFRTGSFFLALFLAAVTSCGVENPEDAKLVREITDNLIAPCCWSSPVSQHFSDVAEQIRAEVREMVAAGKSREEIMDYYVAKYGERILASPRPKGFNVLAYVLPWAALAMGAWFLIVLLKKLRSPGLAVIPPQSIDQRYSEIVEKEIKELED